ncbi:PAS domain-containing protein [Bordetella petrii]|uniref:PAS domain-containing protein n=1 Tax=Bordetella petrii TaxID=94624 RepID=UPI001E50EA82|nr:GAF domain-containing protein [Bordetella petrii]MCD0504133.1 PAS domain-containing protein [Bordetella petrii]
MFTKQVRNPWTDTRARLEDERVMLQRIAAGAPLENVMAHVLQAVEQQSGVDLITSIMFFDEPAGCLRHGVAPGLPPDFVAATDRAAVGPDVASWGAAAYLGSPVYVGDIGTHPNWQPWRELAATHGLRACWSTPIKAADGSLLGVFSNYYRVEHMPAPQDIDAIALVTRTAALAIERHRTEQALRASSERWRGIFQRMQEGFFLCEAMRNSEGRVTDFRFVEVNPAFEQQSGLQAGDTLGHSLREMIPGVPDMIMDTFANVVQTGESAQFELDAPHQGRQAWYEAHVHKEGPDRITVLVLDITARKLAEGELWAEQHRKNFLLSLADQMREIHQQADIELAACEALGRHLNLSVAGVLEFNASGAPIRVSPHWRSELAIADGEAVEPDQLAVECETAYEKGRTSYLSPMLATAQGGSRPAAIAVPLRRWGWPNGMLYVRPHRSSPLKGPDIAFIEEVGERICDAIERSQYARVLEQRVESAIAERDRIWRLSPELLAVMNARGRFVSVNPAVRAILGWTPEQFLAMPLAELVHAEDVQRVRDCLVPGDSSGQVVRHLECRLLNKQAGYSWITWTISWAHDSFYLVGRDDTDFKAQAEQLRQAQAALAQSQKMEAVGQLTGGIAHDFNNMLQGISGALYLIQRKLDAGKFDEAHRFIGTAMDSTGRAARLTQRLLSFSRRQPLDPKPLDPAATMASMEDLFRRYTHEGITLTCQAEPGLHMVKCDINQFESALLNLVINACDAMENGGRLAITMRNTHLDAQALQQHTGVEPGEFVEVTISDEGCGMAPEVLARAFEPFFTTKPLGEGTGLGLSMIYGFARQAGGLINMESTAGQGTLVRLWLPRHAGVPEGQPQDTACGQAEDDGFPDDAVIVLVEDDNNVREMVHECLVGMGLRVLTASDGEEGARLLAGTRQVDLLLTDVGLPGLNGRQLADIARESHPGLNVLFMTGYAQNVVDGSEFQGEGLEVILKPFSLGELIRRVRKMLRHAPTVREARRGAQAAIQEAAVRPAAR